MKDKDKDDTPLKGYLRLSSVLELIPVSRSTWLRGVADKLYPAPIKLAKNTVAWKREDIYSLMKKLNNGYFK